jgi:hypothetical protein
MLKTIIVFNFFVKKADTTLHQPQVRFMEFTGTID